LAVVEKMVVVVIIQLDMKDAKKTRNLYYLN